MVVLVAKDDWRIRIHFDEPAHAGGLLERLGLSLGGEAADLAQQLKSHRLAVSFDEDDRVARSQVRPVIHLDTLGNRFRRWFGG